MNARGTSVGVNQRRWIRHAPTRFFGHLKCASPSPPAHTSNPKNRRNSSRTAPACNPCPAEAANTFWLTGFASNSPIHHISNGIGNAPIVVNTSPLTVNAYESVRNRPTSSASFFRRETPFGPTTSNPMSNKTGTASAGQRCRMSPQSTRPASPHADASVIVPIDRPQSSGVGNRSPPMLRTHRICSRIYDAYASLA